MSQRTTWFPHGHARLEQPLSMAMTVRNQPIQCVESWGPTLLLEKRHSLSNRPTSVGTSIFPVLFTYNLEDRNNVLLAAKEDPLTGVRHISLSLCASWFRRLGICPTPKSPTYFLALFYSVGLAPTVLGKQHGRDNRRALLSDVRWV